MASEVFYNRVPYAQHRPAHHHHDSFAATSNHASTSQLASSVGTSRSSRTLAFPPLYLDPFDPAQTADPNAPSNAAHPGAFILGSTFYHHPALSALVSHHLTDASANDAAPSSLSNPFVNREDDDSEADDPEAANASGVPRPKLTSEFVNLNEDLVPASLDMQGDMLPADQHPSYPFGNLFGPLGGSLAADSAIVGGSTSSMGTLAGFEGDAALSGLDFGGGLDGFINLGQRSHGRRSGVSNSWNGFINRASRSKIVGSSSEWNVDSKDDIAKTETIRSATKLDLSPNLLYRTNTSTVLAPPTWPFRHHGPGCTSYAALLRPSSNVFGSSPASAALAATLGGLPASAKILKEVWSDLALEELLPTRIGDTSAVRHLTKTPETDESDPATGERGKKRPCDPESDSVFAKRIATVEADPLDLLGPVSREIRGHAARPWGTATRVERPRRRRRSNSSDEAAEAEHDDAFTDRDLLRYSFSLPPATFSWSESPERDGEHEPDIHIKPDGIAWSTAKRIFVNEERDRLLPEVASRATANGVDAYRVRGLRANQGVMPRGGWIWGEAVEVDMDRVSFVTEEPSMSGSRHQQEVSDSDEGGEHEVWEQGAEDEELQRALLMQYQQEAADRAEDEVNVYDEEAQIDHGLDDRYGEEDLDDDEDVESFGEAEDTA